MVPSMSRARYILHQLRSQSLGWTLRKLLWRGNRALRHACARSRDALLPPLVPVCEPLPEPLHSLPEVPQPPPAVIALQQNHFCDLLGSGWRSMASAPPPANVPFSFSATQKKILDLLPQTYRTMEWHTDHIFRHSWSGSTWYGKITFGTGREIKYPWELSRLQHLPLLGLAARQAPSDAAEALRQEFRCQVLDWIAHNPPRFGPNWACSMEVAIRGANLALAHDLFRSAGARFDTAFTFWLHGCLRAHCGHLLANPEIYDGFRNNHYLATATGLLFIAAALPPSAYGTRCLAYAAQELLHEIMTQFLPDGGNFEASVPYHRLALELAVNGLCLLFSLPMERIRAMAACTASRRTPLIEGHGANILRLRQAPEQHEVMERVRRAVAFMRNACFGPPGHSTMFQVGDNDNGRLFKLETRYVFLPCRSLSRYDNLSAQTALTPEREYPYEEALDCGHVFTQHARLARLAGLDAASLADPPEAFAPFPDFGVFFYRTPRLRLCLRAGSIGQNGRGGHAHNDQLSLLLACDGLDFLTDPGTGRYTSAPAERNLFRSTRMHNTVSLPEMEQNRFFPHTLFAMHNEARTQVLHATPDSFAAEHYGFGVPHRRSVRIFREKITIEDTIPMPYALLWLHLHPDVCVEVRDAGRVAHCRRAESSITLNISGNEWRLDQAPHSPAYGWMQSAPCLRVAQSAAQFRWSIEPC